jgi:ADP-heptose:LPS heptosyltransferase
MVQRCVQVHLGAGIGNIVLATPLLVALRECGYVTDVVLAADYAETAELLRPWSAVREIFTSTTPFPSAQHYLHVIAAIPPFYWPRYASKFTDRRNFVARPPDALFYQDEQAYYWTFAQPLGCASERRPSCTLPITPFQPSGSASASAQRSLVLAPGCKTGEMAAKRWPYYAELAQDFDDVAVVGTADDLRRYDGSPIQFGPNVKVFVDILTLRETAELLAAANAVVANDTGLAYVSAAVGTPTLILFGPTPNATLGSFPSNVRVLRAGLECEPCWFNGRFQACKGQIHCLQRLSVSIVRNEVLVLLGDQPQQTNKRKRVD